MDTDEPGGAEETADRGGRLGIDVGGTCTDMALVVNDDLTMAKMPTTEDQSRESWGGPRDRSRL